MSRLACAAAASVVGYVSRPAECVLLLAAGAAWALPLSPRAAASDDPPQRSALLPPRSQERLGPLDGDVERSLNPLPWGYSRGLIGRDALIVEGRSQKVMDIIRDVTGRR